MMPLSCRSTILMLTLFAMAGCNEDKIKEQQTTKVTGTVTWNQKPLKSGDIIFDAKNGYPPVSLTILDGHYEGLAPIGNCSIQICSYQKTSDDDSEPANGPDFDEVTETNILPEKYNTNSDISREVKTGSDNTFDFTLTP
ncbi:MAG: hypothetical protein U0798_20375 [Gemmataceae bacterium]